MFTVAVKVQKEVKSLLAECGVRYWEDGEVNGVEEDNDNPSIPLKVGDLWQINVDLETGVIKDWPKGTTAKTHYKVCDAGSYYLLDDEGATVKEIDGYVPSMMCPEGDGYGDYVIMKIDENGKIENWKVDLSDFEHEEE